MLLLELGLLPYSLGSNQHPGCGAYNGAGALRSWDCLASEALCGVRREGPTWHHSTEALRQRPTRWSTGNWALKGSSGEAGFTGGAGAAHPWRNLRPRKLSSSSRSKAGCGRAGVPGRQPAPEPCPPPCPSSLLPTLLVPWRLWAWKGLGTVLFLPQSQETRPPSWLCVPGTGGQSLWAAGVCVALRKCLLLLVP